LPRLMHELSDDPEVRAIVIAAKGPHFTVGLDLKAFGQITGTDGGRGGSDGGRRARHNPPIKRIQSTVTTVSDCPKPVIAAVHGYCIGGGVDLITAWAIRPASADALFTGARAK